MSGFFKGMFGSKEEREEQGLIEGQFVAEEDVTEDISDIQEMDVDALGTVETEAPSEEVFVAPQEPVVPQAALPDPDLFSAETIWQDSGVTGTEQGTVNKAQELLSSLPNETPETVKRQIVEASLKAFEVSIAEIVAGAISEIRSLREYIDNVNTTAADFKEDAEGRIAALEHEIELIRGSIEAAEGRRESLVVAATDVIEEVEPVLSFFNPESLESLKGGSSLSSSVEASDAEEEVVENVVDEDSLESLNAAVNEDVN